MATNTIAVLPTRDQVERNAVKLDNIINVVAPLTPITGATKKYNASLGVVLKWNDPADGQIPWLKTVVVRKAGTPPLTPDDGVTVVVNTVRGRYQEGFTDADGTATDCYRAFPYTIAGNYSVAAGNVFRDYVIYGFYIDESDPDPNTCVHYTGDCADFTPMVMGPHGCDYGDWGDAFFMPHPCAVKFDGHVDYYLSRYDYSAKVTIENPDVVIGSSDVSDESYDGNFMMEFPQIWTKFWRDGNKVCCNIASTQVDETYECWSCKQPYGYVEHFYMPIYEGSIDSAGRLRSWASGAVPTSDTTFQQEYDAAVANGYGWLPTLWCDEQLMRALGVLVFRSLNLSEVLGACYVAGATALSIPCGSLNQNGLFYGDGEEGEIGTKFFGMENWWSHRNRRCLGLALSSDKRFLVKMTKFDGGFVTSAIEADYLASYTKLDGNMGNIRADAFVTSVNGNGVGAMLPALAGEGGSSTTYYCDAVATSGAAQLRIPKIGGCIKNGPKAGLFYMYCGTATEFEFGTGASVTYRPPDYESKS